MSLSGKSILVIDDDLSLLILMRKILETAGCRVEDASSVHAALERIQTKLPDLVILDLNMPKHDGFTFLKFRAQNQLMHSIPVLVLSGETNRSAIQRALAMGANQFLDKPLKAHLVLQKVRYLFYSQEHFSYQFPADEAPAVTAEINGSVVGHFESQVKIASVAKFERGTPLQLKIENYMKLGGSMLVGRIDNRKVDTSDGLYGQYITLVGLSNEERERFQQWESH